MNNEFGKSLLVIAVFGAVFLALMARNWIDSFRRFFRKREYLKIEIARATSHEEREAWQRRLKRLYMSKIPIFNKKNWYTLKGVFHSIAKSFRRAVRRHKRHHRYRHYQRNDK